MVCCVSHVETGRLSGGVLIEWMLPIKIACCAFFTFYFPIRFNLTCQIIKKYFVRIIQWEILEIKTSQPMHRNKTAYLYFSAIYTCVPHTSHHIWGQSPPHHYPSLSLLLPLMLSRWPFLPANPHQKALITAASPQTSPYPIINTADWPADHLIRHTQLACDSEHASICSFLMVTITSWNMKCKTKTMEAENRQNHSISFK